MCREKDWNTAIEQRERRDVEVIVVLVTQEYGVDARKRIVTQKAWREHAIGERMDLPEVLAQQRVHEHAGLRRLDHPALMTEERCDEHVVSLSRARRKARCSQADAQKTGVT